MGPRRRRAARPRSGSDDGAAATPSSSSDDGAATSSSGSGDETVRAIKAAALKAGRKAKAVVSSRPGAALTAGALAGFVAPAPSSGLLDPESFIQSGVRIAVFQVAGEWDGVVTPTESKEMIAVVGRYVADCEAAAAVTGRHDNLVGAVEGDDGDAGVLMFGPDYVLSELWGLKASSLRDVQGRADARGSGSDAESAPRLSLRDDMWRTLYKEVSREDLGSVDPNVGRRLLGDASSFVSILS